MESRTQKVSAAGLLVALGIIYGDIGTSPLYTFQTILRDGGTVTPELVLGGVSAVFWTLTLQTTFKYVFITLQADNHGEGGVFSLYALVRKKGHGLWLPATIGAATLLADGIITPPISVTSAIEGLGGVPALSKIIIPGDNLVIEIVLLILLLLFFFQQFGTKVVGSAFGPIMLLWFLMLSVLGGIQVAQHPEVFKALNPYYAFRLLVEHPQGFWLLGAIFLCTTGAEALYSDLGHCGKGNIRMSWGFVKTALVLNYFGQAAWVLAQHKTSLGEVNPFFAIVPSWFLLPSVLLATVATIIASQALISGSFTLISEAISLGFWPRVKVEHPTDIKGQIYIPSINWLLCAGCFAVALYFRTSERMTAAYGFSITIAMLMTTYLMAYYLRDVKKYPIWLVGAIVSLFVIVETSFFVANAVKIVKRLMFLVVELGIFTTMFVWHRGRKLSRQLRDCVKLHDYVPALLKISADTRIPKYATHLVYLTRSGDAQEVEQEIISSIFARQPKRADVYWFIHIDFVDEPFTTAYSVEELVDDKVIRVDFRLGFRVQLRIHLLLRMVVEEMIRNNEFALEERFTVPDARNVLGDFRFVILQEFLSYDNEFNSNEEVLLNSYFNLRNMAQSNLQAFGLDPSEADIEKIPLVIKPASNFKLERFQPGTRPIPTGQEAEQSI